MEIKKGQIWKHKRLASFIEIVNVNGSAVKFKFQDSQSGLVYVVLEAYIRSNFEFVRNKGDVSRKFEINKAKEIIVKADGLKIGGVKIDEAWINAQVKKKTGVVRPKESVLKKHNHYFKDVSDYKEIDVYALCKIFEIDDPSGCTQHAIKKLLVTGKRGHKDRLRDLQDVVDTVKRLIELESGNE